MFLITVAFGASSSHAVTPGGHDGDQKQQENYAKESFHPNSLLFKNRRFSPIGLGSKVFFLDYAFYQYLDNISIIFWHFTLQWQRSGLHNLNL